MLDLLMQVLVALACAAVTAAVPILLPRALTLISANIHQKDVALIAEAATRPAGRVAVGVAGQMAVPGANLKTVVAGAVATEVAVLKGQVGETIAKVGATDATVASMITGEVGKLLGQGGAQK